MSLVCLSIRWLSVFGCTVTNLPLWVCACKNYKICVRNIYSEVKNGTGSLLTRASLESFTTRRTDSRLTMMYKMTKNLANVDTSDKLIPLQRPSRNCNTLKKGGLNKKRHISSSSVERPPSSDWLFCHFGCAHVKTIKFCVRYKEELQDTSLTDTTTPHLLVICSISLNGHL
jgi:hypothetical protein